MVSLICVFLFIVCNAILEINEFRKIQVFHGLLVILRYPFSGLSGAFVVGEKIGSSSDSW